MLRNQPVATLKLMLLLMLLPALPPVVLSHLQSAKVVLSELHGVPESEVIRRTAPLALLFVVLAQLLGLAWTLGGLWPD